MLQQSISKAIMRLNSRPTVATAKHFQIRMNWSPLLSQLKTLYVWRLPFSSSHGYCKKLSNLHELVPTTFPRASISSFSQQHKAFSKAIIRLNSRPAVATANNSQIRMNWSPLFFQIKTIRFFTPSTLVQLWPMHKHLKIHISLVPPRLPRAHPSSTRLPAAPAATRTWSLSLQNNAF